MGRKFEKRWKKKMRGVGLQKDNDDAQLWMKEKCGSYMVNSTWQ